jgi:hypothetical protein
MPAGSLVVVIVAKWLFASEDIGWEFGLVFIVICIAISAWRNDKLGLLVSICVLVLILLITIVILPMFPF